MFIVLDGVFIGWILGLVLFRICLISFCLFKFEVFRIKIKGLVRLKLNIVGCIN